MRLPVAVTTVALVAACNSDPARSTEASHAVRTDEVRAPSADLEPPAIADGGSAVGSDNDGGRRNEGDASNHDRSDPIPAAVCPRPSPVGAFTVEGAPGTMFGNFADYDDVVARIEPTGFVLSFAVSPRQSVRAGEVVYAGGNETIGFTLGAMGPGVGTYSHVPMHAGDASWWCTAKEGSGVGGTAEDADGGTVTITLLAADRVEGSVAFASGGAITFRAPIELPASPQATSWCCPK